MTWAGISLRVNQSFAAEVSGKEEREGLDRRIGARQNLEVMSSVSKLKTWSWGTRTRVFLLPPLVQVAETEDSDIGTCTGEPSDVL